MTTTKTTTREHLHQLVDRLPDDELHAAGRYLEFLEQERAGDRFYRMLQDAPIDDEAETPEEAAAVAEAYEDIAAGRTVTHAEARRRLLGHS